MSEINNVINNLEKRRDKVINGGINCIPSSFTRFRSTFPGIEKHRYYLVTAMQKCGKTQITSYLFFFEPIMYCYYNRDKARIKIFYYPLEETKQDVIERFMSYTLFNISEGRVRISPLDLRSTNEQKVLPQEVLDLLKSEEYQNIFKFFEESVVFCESTNPTGMWKEIVDYAEATGTIHYKEFSYTDSKTGEVITRNKFDYYEPNNPNEYVMILWDHLSLTSLERGMTLRETINKLSEYFVLLRNKYDYTIVAVQQQNTETQGLEAYKNNKIRPTATGLEDSKKPGKDCNYMLGLTNPYCFELPSYAGYNIMELKDSFRLFEVIVNRHGTGNDSIGLYFDGAVTYFKELPPPLIDKKENPELQKFYEIIKYNQQN